MNTLLVKTVVTLFGVLWITILTLCLSMFANHLINNESLMFVGFGLTLYALALSFVLVFLTVLYRFWSVK